jgi:REP element-mobilizing transposase RayT
VTLCTHKWRNLFGEINSGKIVLNSKGWIVDEQWQKTATLRPHVTLDEYIIMPNHFHAILMIMESGKDTARRVPTTECFGKPVPMSLPTIIRAFKSAATKHINELRLTPGYHVWQRNYFEHVIRTDHALNRIRTYIRHNPAQWEMDEYNPDANRPVDFNR